jgi:pimeloyl-ACP methyl ester carboxylesterase/uncharacterized protein YndB with AHSA1/START domain
VVCFCKFCNNPLEVIKIIVKILYKNNMKTIRISKPAIEAEWKTITAKLSKTVIIISVFMTTSTSTFAQSHKGYAPVNGLQLYYEIHGTGEPLVLLHGGLGAIEMFGPNLQALAKSNKVIAADLQGHGRTADIDRPLSPELMADDIIALLKYLKIEKTDLMGYSLGGGVALQVAFKRPEMVRKLVIVSIPFKKNGFYPEILAQQAQIGPEAAEFMKQTPMYQLYAKIAPRVEDWPVLLTKIGKAMKIDYDWTPRLKTLKTPTLFVAGDADMFPPSHAVEFFGLLGGGQRDGGWDGSGKTKSQLAILPNTTHYDIFMSPALVLTVLSFLNSKDKNNTDTTMKNKKENLVFTCTFNAPLEDVWKAFTKPEYVMQWWGPNGFTCPLAKIDFREGGTSLVCMRSPQFGDMYSIWQYKAIDPMKRIEYIHNLADKDGNKIDPATIGMPADFPQDMRNDVVFKNLGNGKTEITITEYDWPEGQMKEMSKIGMEQCLDKMAAIFAKK